MVEEDKKGSCADVYAALAVLEFLSPIRVASAFHASTFEQNHLPQARINLRAGFNHPLGTSMGRAVSTIVDSLEASFDPETYGSDGALRNRLYYRNSRPLLSWLICFFSPDISL